MKVEIEKSMYGNKIIFHINSREDAVEFHDKIAIKINAKQRKFIRDCYELTQDDNEIHSETYNIYETDNHE